MKFINYTALTSLVLTASAWAGPLAGQLGVLDLAANGGINPNTGVAWAAGDQYRLAFYTDGETKTESNDPQFYYDFVNSQAWAVTALQGSYWAPMIALNLDSSFTDATAPVRTVKEFSGTSDLTGGAGVGGAGEPVYVMNGTTCIARNNADIWNYNYWSNPFDGDNSLRLPATTVPPFGVFYSPYLTQNGVQLVEPDANHGATCATGCDGHGNSAITPAYLLGNSADADPSWTRTGNSNANLDARVFSRFQNTASTLNRLYVISYPLTIVDLSDNVDPALVSFVDDKGGADVTRGVDKVVYTVSFDEGMNPSTVNTTDFEITGTGTATIDLIRPTFTSAGTFEVIVTPTSAGTITLQSKVGATFTDFVGNAVDTTSAITDDTTITVLAGTPPFDSWTAGPFLGTLSNTAANVDFDNGGLATGVEWVVGGDPTDGSDDSSVTPLLDNTTDPDFLIFTYRRSDAAFADANTAIKVQYSTDMSGWSTAEASADIIITPTDNGVFDSVEVKIRRSAFAINGKLFARLNVVVTP